MSAHWLDRTWHYHSSATHNGDGFRRRQRERIRQAELARKADAAAQVEQAIKVRQIKRREA